MVTVLVPVCLNNGNCRNTMLVTFYFTPLLSACFDVIKQFYHHQTYIQRICEIYWNLWCWCWHQGSIESRLNSDNDWHGAYGDMLSPSSYASLLGTSCWALQTTFDPTPGIPQEHDSTPRRLSSVYPRQVTHVLFTKNGPVESECKLNNVNPHIIRNQYQIQNQ